MRYDKAEFVFKDRIEAGLQLASKLTDRYHFP